MKKININLLIMAMGFLLYGCGNSNQNEQHEKSDSTASNNYSSVVSAAFESGGNNPFSISLNKVNTNYYLPALQSFAEASYNGLWIIIGGQVVGFHGTSNNPAPFMTSFANDSMWVIDPVQGKSYGVPIPASYWNTLSSSNAQSYQVGNDLYLCGGYTVTDATQPRFNTTSNHFFKINLPNFVSYVQSGGKNPAINEVFPIAFSDNFVRVSGGELFIENNHFYLIGGQDYEGAYSLGLTGKYTNAIRSFTLQQNGNNWGIGNKDSLVDPVNLHRRDFNIFPYVEADNSVSLMLQGGVFTTKGLSYNNPIYIKGLAAGTPSITVGSTEQKCNQYTCANIPFMTFPGTEMMYANLGGITYMQFDPDSNKLVVGDNGIPMPFSNLVNFIYTDGNTSQEYVQLPPKALLPGYLGSNAAFMPISDFLANGFNNILDINKILIKPNNNIKIGYLYGGILSNGPTSGTTPQGHVNTYANKDLYEVILSYDVAASNKTESK